jgi:hypothetical protein
MSKSNKSGTTTTNTNPSTEETAASQSVLYSFPKQGKGKWRVQDDVVMGGRSDSQLKMTADDYAHFSGRVSLENNGGFCSIHQVIEDNPYQLNDQAKAFVLDVKGDGKDYNFRVRTPNGRHSYGFTFPTNNKDEWETITIPFAQMEAKFHGEPVDVPNYAGEDILEMQLLIGNKKEETFEVLIKSIGVS